MVSAFAKVYAHYAGVLIAIAINSRDCLSFINCMYYGYAGRFIRTCLLHASPHSTYTHLPGNYYSALLRCSELVS